MKHRAERGMYEIINAISETRSLGEAAQRLGISRSALFSQLARIDASALKAAILERLREERWNVHRLTRERDELIQENRELRRLRTGSPGRFESARTNGADPNDPYAVLGLTNDAELEVVKAAHLALVKKYHPDRGGSEEMMKKINAAHDKITDNHARGAR
jgi:molybdenum-dependent DNA-binding transcriptional regulator ModE